MVGQNGPAHIGFRVDLRVEIGAVSTYGWRSGRGPGRPD
jgi:hypothetical protein